MGIVGRVASWGQILASCGTPLRVDANAHCAAIAVCIDSGGFVCETAGMRRFTRSFFPNGPHINDMAGDGSVGL